MDNKLNSVPQAKSPKKRIFWISGSIAVLVVIGLVIFGIYWNYGRMTVEDYQARAEQEINQALSNSGHSLRKYVENAHKTVNVHTAYVSNLKITTKDGSKNVGADGKNIRQIHIEITTRWNGIFHKNGCTVVGVDLENINGERKVTNSRIIKTDAVVNVEDPNFWYEVGIVVAYLLL